jgi:hypothetical protein
MTRNEILSNIYCPASGGGSMEIDSADSMLSTASAVCIEGSRAALALSWSNHGSRNLDARRQEALRNVIEKSASTVSLSRSEQLSTFHSGPSTISGHCDRSEHKNFVVVSHGFPIDPDYNIVSHPPATSNDPNASCNGLMTRSMSFPSPSRLTSSHEIRNNCTIPATVPPTSRRSRPKTSIHTGIIWP